jgi:resuscitation-promoting factor RpfB
LLLLLALCVHTKDSKGEVMRSLKSLSLPKKVGLGGISLLLLSGIVSGAASPPAPVDKTTVVSTVSQTAEPSVVEKKTVSEKESVAYGTTQVNDAALTQGITTIRSEGKEGTRVRVYEVTYEQGVETDRKLVSDQITIQPTTKVVAVGTKVELSCPEGTYVNASGVEVCRPYASNSAPSGATALCQDGTYSFSQSRRGTCSHHGGVARWL